MKTSQNYSPDSEKSKNRRLENTSPNLCPRALRTSDPHIFVGDRASRAFAKAKILSKKTDGAKALAIQLKRAVTKPFLQAIIDLPFVYQRPD